MISKDKDNTKRLIDCMGAYSTRENTLRLGIEVIRTLISYRNMGIYHKVITPKEIIVSPDGSISISLIMPNIPEGRGFTSPVQLYTAPEYTTYDSSEATVIYSLGTVMYRLMNGDMEPFRNGTDYESAVKAYRQRMSGSRPSAPYNADAPLSVIILKACEYNVSLRYSTLNEMLSELMSLANGSFQRGEGNEEVYVEEEPKRKSLAPVFFSLLSGIAVAAIIIFCINFHYNDIYIRAERRLRDERFDEARQMFEDISWYKDSAVMRLRCDYREAQYFADNNKLDEAIVLLDALSKIDFEESADILNDILLKKAEELNAQGKTHEAEKIMQGLAQKGGNNAALILKEQKYDTAMELYTSGEYEKAAELFKGLGDEEMVTECTYSLAKKHMNDGRYAKAMGVFSMLGDFGNSEENFSLCEEWLCEENRSKSYNDYLGTFTSESGRYVKYTKENNTLRSNYNLPFTDGTYFKIDRGRHYNSKDGKTWKIQWIIQKTSSGMEIYSYIDKKTYVLIGN